MDPVASEGIEHLRESRRDLIAFIGAFAAGFAIYTVLHVVLHMDQVVVTTTILAVMVAYAVFVAKVPRVRVRLDQAGDNAYYLGLLFTLMSMAFALYEFGVRVDEGRSGVDQIIANFGIALASTVMGILLRVILHQMRVDPADVESMTRIELSEASRRMRASLETLQIDFSRFHNEVRQRTGDVVSQLLTDAASAMSNLTGELANTTKGMLATTAATQQDVLKRTTDLTRMLEENATAARAAAERLKGIEAPPLTLSKRLQKLSDVMEELGGNLEKTGGRFSAVDTGASTAIARIAESAELLVRVSHQMEQSQNVSGQQLAVTMKSVSDALTAVGKGLERDRQLFDEIADSARLSASEAGRAQSAATEMLRKLTETTQGLIEIVKRAN